VTGALVSRNGSIDWLCWPSFDSGACCAALLGGPENGYWSVRPADASARSQRRYHQDTLVLETVFRTARGAVAVIDFMPIGARGSHVVRIVRGKSGRVAMRSELVLRFDYGSLIPWATRLEDGRHSYIAGPDRVVLSATAPQHGEDLATVGDFSVSAGETICFVLSYSRSYDPLPAKLDGEEQLATAEKFWRRWVARSSDAGEYSSVVRRSLIVLKALTYRPTGGILAAATTSIPERNGGIRNWDYRYCWVRDATFTLQAMMNGGHYAEARKWREWLLRAAAGDPARLQTVYRITGARLLPEWEIPWLAGFQNSAPVRVGNAASTQQQLDTYGELMDAMHQGRCGKLAANAAGWQLQATLLKRLEDIWQQPDRGIWEVRGRPCQFTHSKVMAWVAVDRMIRSAEQFRLEAPLGEWRQLRAQIHDDVCRRGFNRRMGSFVRCYGSTSLDASLLLLPIVGFLPAGDPRIRGTVDAIRRNLTEDGLVKRYSTTRTKDGLPPGEGVFIACSFWLVDCLLLLERREEARKLFQRLLGLCNDVGLLAEEYNPRTRRLVGNFPQAFSHIALINSAHNLTREHGPARQRGGRPHHSQRHAK